MDKKYFNDAVVGNNNITASFSKKGELLRLCYPDTDYKQYIESLETGLKINDSALIYLHEDINNEYYQSYLPNTNVLQTEILNTYFNLRTIQTDFVPINENILVKNYRFINESNIDLNVNFLVHSKALTGMVNDTSSFCKNDCLIQFTHDDSVCIFSKNKLLSYQVNSASYNFHEGVIGGKDYIGLSPDSSISYDIGTIKPGKEAEIDICVFINNNEKICLLNDLDVEIERFRKIDFKKSLEDTKKYWKKYVKDHDRLLLEKSDVDEKIKKIYNRTILLYPLLINQQTGGIAASFETDEFKTRCGKYAFCWPRDSIFIAKAFDILKMEDESKLFYEVFCKKTQSRDGRWEQRFYTDGRLASCWGFQIDETASVIIGVYDHYKFCKDKKFLKETLKMCENAIKYLEKYVDKMISGKLTEFGYDLWEEYEGLSFYSVSSIFCAYDRMIKIYKEVIDMFDKNRLKKEAINKQLKLLDEQIVLIKDFALKTFYDEDKKSFVRNLNDRRMDISLLGAVVPFGMLKPTEKIVENTIERIDMTIRTYTGGYVRYENDGYIGGYNPWPIATLWMALYNIEKGDYDKAMENFTFVVTSCSEYGFLGEQVDNQTRKPAWIIGLAWSHAMFIIVLEKLKKLKLL